jgi:hypothetical protein
MIRDLPISRDESAEAISSPLDNTHGLVALQYAPAGAVTLSAIQRAEVIAFLEKCMGAFTLEKPTVHIGRKSIFRRHPEDSDEEHRQRILNAIEPGSKR